MQISTKFYSYFHLKKKEKHEQNAALDGYHSYSHFCCLQSCSVCVALENGVCKIHTESIQIWSNSTAFCSRLLSSTGDCKLHRLSSTKLFGIFSYFQSIPKERNLSMICPLQVASHSQAL